MARIKKVCPVCKSKKQLTLHHVLPSYIVKCINIQEKQYFLNGANSYKLCRECHDKYEKRAIQLRKILLAKCDYPKNAEGATIVDFDIRKLRDLSRFLLGKFPKNQYGYGKIRAYLFFVNKYKKFISKRMLKKMSKLDVMVKNPDYINSGQFLIEKIGIRDLDRMYRKDLNDFLIKKDVEIENLIPEANINYNEI